MTPPGPQPAAGPPVVELAVAASVLCHGTDTSRTRLFRAWLDERGTGPWSDPLAGLADFAARLPLAPARRTARLAEATRLARLAIQAAAEGGLVALVQRTPGYPALLGEIPDPPVVLWVRGQTPSLSAPAVAVVGSRAATPAGRLVAARLGGDLARAGITVVSGLARGIDGAAHQAALEAGGQTLAVLGCGADVVYPREHRELAGRIAASGAVVSELLPGSPPLAFHFPLRNRVISGLSRAVVVVEAGERSGSLITARAALEQGRDVLAVPGGITSGRHRGSHALIKDGARLVETVDDVLDEIGWSPRTAAAPDSSANIWVSKDLEIHMPLGEPCSVDDLVAAAGWSIPRVLSEIGRLELAGRVARIGGGAFVRLDGPAMDREQAGDR